MTNPTELQGCLADFRQRVNTTARIRMLLKGWDRTISVDSTDSDEGYMLVFTNTEVVDITPKSSREELDADIYLRARTAILVEIFSGVENPAVMFLDGRLSVVANDKDQIKLDAIALVLWD
jgi:SCP-2 sterol transfer family